MTYPPPQRRPPSKYLALWISLPIVALIACCGGVGALLGDDGKADGKPQPVASIAGLPGSSGSASGVAGTPSSTPSTAPSSAPAASPAATPATTTTSPPTAGTTATTTTRPAAPPTTTRPAAPPTTRTTPPSSVYYANCDAVRAAGKAPLYRGQPGYRAGLDRDDDGVACE